jgi:hypothetical protein
VKSICIHVQGQSFFFDYEEGNEEELLVSILDKAQQNDTPFTVDDVVAIVKNLPHVFSGSSKNL